MASGLLTGICRSGLDFPRVEATSECGHGRFKSCITPRCPITIERDIEMAPMPSRFTQPPFNSYDGKTNPMEHVSHYIQMMSLHTHNDALMCKVFPLNLGPTALRWLNGLKKGLIHSLSELIQEFGVWFMTCSQVPQLVDALL